MIYIEIPPKVERILNCLHGNGYEAYIVGGCVRDSILGRTPEDWDITTSATPAQVKALFPRTIDTGIRHGTVTVMDGKEGFEVTTYRIDGDYEDSRHPKEVSFTASLNEDLCRRDFTINAMAYSQENGLMDFCGGLEDLNAKLIRCVGEAKTRFGEDALRMLRAVRFAAQLGFALDEETRAAICELAPNIARVSQERIQAELVKLLLSPRPQWFRLAYDCGLTAVFMPEFDRIMQQQQHNPHHTYSTGEHTLVALQNIPPTLTLRLTMLFHDIGKPEVFRTDENGRDHFHGHAVNSAKLAEQIMRRLKFDNETINTVCTLVYHHSRYPQLNAQDVRVNAYEIGPELFDQFLLVKRADILAQHPDVVREKLDYLEEVERIWKDIRENHDCLSLKELAVSGRDLIAEGFQPGPQIGQTLEKLMREVLAHPEHNQRAYLLQLAKEGGTA